MAVLLHGADEVFEIFHLWRRPAAFICLDARSLRIAAQQHTQAADAEDVDGPQWHDKARHGVDERCRCLQSGPTTLLHGLCGHVFRALGLKGAVHDEALIAHADGTQLFGRAFGFTQRRTLRTAHEHERGGFGIGERLDRGFINHALLFQTGQRPEAGCAAGVFVEKLVPRLCQTH